MVMVETLEETTRTVDDATHSQSLTAQTFTIPLALLTVHSNYFRSAFDSELAASQRGCIRLSHTSPWAFRVFAGWLYHQRVFYDPECTDARRFSMPRSTSTKGMIGNDIEPANSTQAAASGQCNSAELAGVLTDMGTSDTGCLKKVPSKDATWPRAETQAIGDPPPYSTMQPSLMTHHPPGGNQNKFSQPLEVAYGEDYGDDECYYQDAVTWPWAWLFEIYVLAEKLDVRALRMQIMFLIQLKAVQIVPRRYNRPSNEDLTFVTERLPRTSPLYEFLVVHLAFSRDLSEGKDLDYADLPAHFMSRCFAAARRALTAADCDGCKTDGMRECCAGKAHNTKIHRTIFPCDYHEHDNDRDEQARCLRRWNSVKSRFSAGALSLHCPISSQDVGARGL